MEDMIGCRACDPCLFAFDTGPIAKRREGVGMEGAIGCRASHPFLFLSWSEDLEWTLGPAQP